MKARHAVKFFAIALAFQLLAGAASATQLKVGKADSTDYDFALLQVGIDAGIFKKYNLELETVTLPGAQLHQAMTANSIDLALGSGTDFQFIAKGAPEKGVAAFAGAPINLAILVRMDGKINKVDDLKGRIVAVSTNGSLTYWLTTELSRRLGWSGDDAIKPVAAGNLEAQVAALRAGQVDGASGNIETGYRLEAQGQAKSLVPFGKYINPFITHAIFATNNMIQNHPDDVRNFLKGWFETIAFMKTHKDKAVDISSKVLGFSTAVTSRVYDEQIGGFSTDGIFDPAAVATLKESFIQMGLLKQAPPDDELFTTQFVPVKV